MTGVVIRDARAADHAAIRRVELDAFAGEGEADLVDALRASGDVVLELVADWDEKIVGHILFSRLTVVSGNERFPAVALAPLAVLPDSQGIGIGGMLVIEAHCRLAPREKLSIVLGERSYYRHFGYAHARAAGFDSDYQCESLQALAWGDAPVTGRLVYAAPFGAL
jgi:putative acetyltransferase